MGVPVPSIRGRSPSTHPSYRRKYLLRLEVRRDSPDPVVCGMKGRPVVFPQVGRGDSLSRPSTLSRESVGRGDSLSRPSTLSREYVGRGDSLSRPSTLSREYVGRGDSLSRPSTLSREYVGRGDSLSRPSTLSRESIGVGTSISSILNSYPRKACPVPRYGAGIQRGGRAESLPVPDGPA